MMDEINISIKLWFNRMLGEYDISYLGNKLNQLQGVQSFDINQESVIIEYIPMQVTAEYIKESIQHMGYQLASKSSKEGFFKRFINNLARSNKKTYGDKKLDCCELKQKQ